MNWLKYKNHYLLFSLALVIISIVSLLTWGLRLGVDFSGGTLIEHSFSHSISTEEVTTKLEEQGLSVQSIQETGENNYLFRLKTLSDEDKLTFDTVINEIDTDESATELRFETVGPSIGSELIKKTGYAIIIAAVVILLWVAYQFKSFTFGASAIIAMLHDSFILIGTFSLLGHFFGAELDFLFVTALLTTLSFSVHDTIVVFDRIREISKTEFAPLPAIANKALTETMVRSLNNSFTIIFMLVALLLMGGSTIKWFAAALLTGTILGTYSSPFVAIPLLVHFTDLKEKLSKKS